MRFELPKKDLVSVFVSYVCPMVEYATQVWHGSLTDGQSKKLESIQIMSLPKCAHYTYPGEPCVEMFSVVPGFLSTISSTLYDLDSDSTSHVQLSDTKKRANNVRLSIEFVIPYIKGLLVVYNTLNDSSPQYVWND